MAGAGWVLWGVGWGVGYRLPPKALAWEEALAGIGVGLQELALGCGLSETLPGAGPRGLKTARLKMGDLEVGEFSPSAGAPDGVGVSSSMQGLEGTQLVPRGPHGEAAALCPGRCAEGRQACGRQIVQAGCRLSSSAPGPLVTWFGQAGWWPWAF